MDELKQVVYSLIEKFKENGEITDERIYDIISYLEDAGYDFDYQTIKNIFDSYLKELTEDSSDQEIQLEAKKKDPNDAGNVEYNIAMFNKGFAGQSGDSAGQAAGCSESIDHIYINPNDSAVLESLDGEQDDVLLEAGVGFLTGKRVLSKKEFIQKLFSVKNMPQLLLTPGLTFPTVVNAGGKGTEPVDPSKENKSIPAPGFSLSGNIGSSKAAEDRYKDSKDTHHVYGFHNGSLGEIKINLGHDVHAGVHNYIWRELANEISTIIDPVYEEYVENMKAIDETDSFIYASKAGLVIRQVEYTLREMGLEVQEKLHKKISTLVLEKQAEALGQFINKYPAPIFNANKDNLLKIKTKSGKIYYVLPMILTSEFSNPGKLQDEVTRYGLISSNGTYLQDIKKEDSFFMLALVNLDPGSDDMDPEKPAWKLFTTGDQLNDFKEEVGALNEFLADVDSITALDSLSEHLIVEDEEYKYKEFISPVAIREILENNFRYSFLQNDGKLDIGKYPSVFGSTVQKLISDLEKNSQATFLDKLRVLDEKLPTYIKSFVDFFFKKNPCEIYLTKPVLDIDLVSSEHNSFNGEQQIKLPLSEVIVVKNNEKFLVDNIIKEKAYPFEDLIANINRGYLIKQSASCPIFLGDNGEKVIGLEIKIDSPDFYLSTTPGFDYSKIAVLDFTKLDEDKELFDVVKSNAKASAFVRAVADWIARGKFTALKKIIWNNLLPLCPNLFSNCSASEYVNIFDYSRLNVLPRRLFAFSKVKSVIIPPFIKQVYEYCFLGCRELTDVYLPKGVSLEEHAFDTCPACTVHYAGSANEYKASDLSKVKWGKTAIKKLVFSSPYGDIKYVPFTFKATEGINESIDTIELPGKDNKSILVSILKQFDNGGLLLSPKSIEDLYEFVSTWIKKSKNNESKSFMKNNSSEKLSKYISLFPPDRRLDARPFDLQIFAPVDNNKLSNLYIIIGTEPVLKVFDWQGKEIELNVFFNDYPELFDYYTLESFKDITSSQFKYPSYAYTSSYSIFNALNNALKNRNTTSTTPITSVEDLYDNKEILKVPLDDFYPMDLLDILYQRDYDQFLAYQNDYDLDIKNHADMAADLSKVKLTGNIIALLKQLGYEEDDFYKALEDPALYEDLYNIIVNSYQKTNAAKLLYDLKDNLVNGEFAPFDLSLDYKNKTIDISIKSLFKLLTRYPDIFRDNGASLENFTRWISTLTLPNSSEEDKREARTRLLRAIKEPIYKIFSEILTKGIKKEKYKYSTKFWQSLFLPIFEENLKKS